MNVSVAPPISSGSRRKALADDAWQSYASPRPCGCLASARATASSVNSSPMRIDEMSTLNREGDSFSESARPRCPAASRAGPRPGCRRSGVVEKSNFPMSQRLLLENESVNARGSPGRAVATHRGNPRCVVEVDASGLVGSHRQRDLARDLERGHGRLDPTVGVEVGRIDASIVVTVNVNDAIAAFLLKLCVCTSRVDAADRVGPPF